MTRGGQLEFMLFKMASTENVKMFPEPLKNTSSAQSACCLSNVHMLNIFQIPFVLVKGVSVNQDRFWEEYYFMPLYPLIVN